MHELVRWLGEQLDEDEKRARACPGDGTWNARDIAVYGAGLSPEVREHMAAHDPARVLREIDAKRRTLIRCEEAMLSASPMLVHFAKQTAWEMAQPYAGSSGFRKEWAP